MTQLSVNDLYVISDLHIGGKARQIFAGKAELKRYGSDLYRLLESEGGASTLPEALLGILELGVV